MTNVPESTATEKGKEPNRKERLLSNRAAPPEVIAVNPDGIPPELKAKSRWVCWTWEWRDNRNGGKWTKPPINARTGKYARWKDPSSLSTFAEALAAFQARRVGATEVVGIGYVLDKDEVGIDLDNAIDEQGELRPWAAKIVTDLNTWTEVSPTRTGLHLICLGHKPPWVRCKKQYGDGEVEAYDEASPRYLTITGQLQRSELATVEERTPQVEAFCKLVWGEPQQDDQHVSDTNHHPPPWPESPTVGPTGAADLDDDELLRLAFSAKNGEEFRRLWQGDTSGHGGDVSAATLALLNHLRWWSGGDRAQVDRLFRRSGLMRPKWDEKRGNSTWGEGRLDKAMKGNVREPTKPQLGQKEARPGSNMWSKFGWKEHMAEATPGSPPPKAKAKPPPGPQPWPELIPLDTIPKVPPFPADVLPSWMRDWVVAEAQATQTPTELAGMLVLALAGAGLAGRYRVQIRPGWSQPTNLFCVVALLPGERKSTVFEAALAPVVEKEKEAIAARAPLIAEAESQRRVLEGRLKKAEADAAKASGAKREELTRAATDLARAFDSFVVPARPRFHCDDETPESLARLLAEQGGRILQASAEGTAFEIAKGRYSEKANFDVYLKGHEGDTLRIGRVSRKQSDVDKPALSLALAVQPDVISGLASEPSMRGRGFLARFLYAMPVSLVGHRAINAPAVPPAVSAAYTLGMGLLWDAPDGDVVLLHFTSEADAALQELEQWIEPRMGQGQDLANTAGWACKLAGAVARIAAILHMAAAMDGHGSTTGPIEGATVRAAIRLGREYLIPHAQAALALMGADPGVAAARRVLRWLTRYPERVVFTANEVYQGVRDNYVFRKPESVDDPLKLLEQHGYLRPMPEERRPGRPSRRFERNPAWRPENPENPENTR